MKHAFLIIAHKMDETFKTLIEMLDYNNNDIFIHMDKKVKFCHDELICKQSRLFFTERISVGWGGYSLIKVELLLLKKAIETGTYEFYHLLSGEDLPIKNNLDFHKFFDNNRGKEFLSFKSKEFNYNDRVQYFYPFQDYIGKNQFLLLRILQYTLLYLQKIFKVQRNRNIEFRKGATWFSITDDLARYVVAHKEWIERTFKYSYCCDEVFLQTLVYNSTYKNKLFYSGFDNDYVSIQRLIDWDRGNPYVFRRVDFKEIENSDMMIARKFQSDVDLEIIEKVKKRFG